MVGKKIVLVVDKSLLCYIISAKKTAFFSLSLSDMKISISLFIFLSHSTLLSLRTQIFLSQFI